MRITWNGSLSFGLVSIPVGLAPATKPAARQSDVSFRLLHREDLTPIKQKRWCPAHDREVPADELVKGWEVSKGRFVVVEDAELEALERHDDSRTIDIERFVPLAEIDPVWMDRTYFLVPGAAPAQRKPYKLLLEVMEEAEVGAVGRFVRSGRESLCLVRPRGRGLVLETLYLRDDVYSQAEIDEAMDSTDVKKPELELARQIVQGLSTEFEPDELTSSYRRNLRALLEAKLSGEEIAEPEPAAEPAPAVDLLEALKASVAAAKSSHREEACRKDSADEAREEAGGLAREPLPALTAQRASQALPGRLLPRPNRLELCLEEVLVDLALVDRDAFRDADPDDRLAVHVELLRKLVGRQVICHRPSPFSGDEKARRRSRVRTGSIGARTLVAGINGPVSRNRPCPRRILRDDDGPQRPANHRRWAPSRRPPGSRGAHDA